LVESGVDTITDFNPQDEIIEVSLTESGNPALFPIGPLDPSRLVIGSSATDSNDRVIYNSANGDLFYDSDGTGSSGQSPIAKLDSGLAIEASNFILTF
jgi:Ca2+-binding RTX toxin-like protein